MMPLKMLFCPVEGAFTRFQKMKGVSLPIQLSVEGGRVLTGGLS